MNNPYAGTTKEFKTLEQLEPRCALEPYLNIEFPQASFPSRIREICDHLHAINGTPLEMLYFCAAGVAAGVAGNRYKTSCLQGKEQHLNQYFTGLARSGTGKTSAIEPLFKAVETAENKTFKDFKRDYENGVNGIIDPTYIFEDTTSESLTFEMSKKNIPAFSISDEGRKVFSVICGEYKKAGSDGVSFYNKAWSGSTYRCSRRNLDITLIIENAFLSSLWLVQPDVITILLSNEAIKESGFLWRLLLFKTNAKIQDPIENPPEIGEQILYKWNSFILDLNKRRNDKDVVIMPCSSEARKFFYNYACKIASLRREIGEYEAPFTRSAEKAMRLSLLFAMCDNANTITEQHARNACAVVDYSDSVMLEILSNGYKARAEENRARIEAFFKERGAIRLTFGQFRQYKRIEAEQLEQAAQEYPTLFKIETGQTNGKVIHYTPQEV